MYFHCKPLLLWHSNMPRGRNRNDDTSKMLLAGFWVRLGRVHALADRDKKGETGARGAAIKQGSDGC